MQFRTLEESGRNLGRQGVPDALHSALGLNLGSDVLEVLPGPGASTELLHSRVARLTCVEADHTFAEKLRRRLDQSVCVMCRQLKLLRQRGKAIVVRCGHD